MALKGVLPASITKLSAGGNVFVSSTGQLTLTPTAYRFGHALSSGAMVIASTDDRLGPGGTQTSAYTAKANEYVPYNTASGTFIITLPPTLASTGQGVGFWNSSGNVTALTITSDEEIETDGWVSINVTLSGARFVMISTGTIWTVHGLTKGVDFVETP